MTDREVHREQSDDRVVLLLFQEERPCIATLWGSKSNDKLYGKSKAVADYNSVSKPAQFTLNHDDWEKVADYLLTLAEKYGYRLVSAVE